MGSYKVNGATRKYQIFLIVKIIIIIIYIVAKKICYIYTLETVFNMNKLLGVLLLLTFFVLSISVKMDKETSRWLGLEPL